MTTPPLRNGISVMERMADWPLLLAVRRGLTIVLPLIITGAFALLLLNAPIPGLGGLLDASFGGSWRMLCRAVQEGSFGIASLAVVISTTASYARLRGTMPDGRRLSPTITSAVCLSAYFVLAAPLDRDIARGFFSLGSGGFPIALCVALTSAPLFIFLSRHSPFSRFLNTVSGDLEVNEALVAVPAGMLTIFLFGLARVFFETAGLGDLHRQAQVLFGAPFVRAGPTLLTALLGMAASQLLWLFGMHGPNLLIAVAQDLLTPASLANIQAAAAGLDPQFILTKPFIDVFANIGGSGGTLSLILVIMLKSKDVSARRLALVALVPAVFNVNEVLLFGLPLVLNPIYAIPFLLAPVVQTLVSYVATALGWVPKTISDVHWTTPILIGGVAATGSWTGAALQLVNLALGAVMYLPFVSLADSIQHRRFGRTMAGLMAAAGGNTTSPGGKKLTDLPGREGVFAKALAADLARALDRDDQIYLQYQPQVNVLRSRAIGAEALLRWEHPVHGMIPPHVAVALAEDTGLIGRLGLRVLTDACMQHAVLLNRGMHDAVLSVNMSALQFEDEQLVDKVIGVLRSTGLVPNMLKIEVTESVALRPEARSVSTLRRLRDHGVRVAIDDFGMGHTSLRYLREFPVDTIKIDRTLTQESTDGINDHIVSSIVGLCQALDIQIIVEGVETIEQIERFRAHGCFIFQGFYYSRPLSGEAYINYMCQGLKDCGELPLPSSPARAAVE